MVTHDYDDDNKRSEGGEKRCFDLFATLLLALGDDETNMLMIRTITTAATNTFLLGSKRKIDDHDGSKNQDNTASSSYSNSSSLSDVVESKRRRVVSLEEPIRAQLIREIKPPAREINRPVKRKEPVRREPVEAPGWVVDLMKKKNGEGEHAKMIMEKVMTTTDLTRNQGRLLMPFNQMAEDDFLNEAESKILEEHYESRKDAKKGGGDVKKGVDVILLHRNGEKEWNLNMRIWEMRSNLNYALCSGWNQVVRDNKLKRNQTIRLWSFHSHDGTLYFAFDPPDEEEDPFVCEEANRRLSADIPRQRRTPRVCVNLLECGGFDLNTTPPPECTEMVPDLEALVQETHFRDC